MNASPPGPSRVLVLALAGQSNAEGRGLPISSDLDPEDSSILMWEWSSSALTTATVPLSSRGRQVGLSIGTVVAREARIDDSSRPVVIMNGAVGGSPLAGVNDRGSWRWGHRGPGPALAHGFIEAVEQTLHAVAIMWPGAAVDLRILWHQGESDFDGDAYITEFDRLIDAVRSRLGDAPVVLGGMVPEYVAATPELRAIRDAHLDTPRRVHRTVYVDGVSGGGCSAGPDDVLHYSRHGAEQLGRAMHRASEDLVVAHGTALAD